MMELDSVSTSPELYNSSIQDEVPAGRFEDFQQFLSIANRYIIPIIIITGVIGNSISFVVFVGTKLKRLATSVYLAALAFVDTCFLLCLGIGWLGSLGIDVFHGPGICQVVVWFTYVFSFLSVWFVVCFTTEMYICIFYPDLSQKTSRPITMRIVVCFFFSLACLLYVYSLWTAKSTLIHGKMFCLPFTESRNMLIGLTIADNILSLLLPFSLLIFMNTRIVLVTIRIFGRDTSTRITSTDGTLDDDQSANHLAKTASKMQRKTMKMLATVAIVFLLLNLPSHAVRAQAVFRTLFQPNYMPTKIEFILQQFAQLLYYFNFAINFVIYNICEKSFRRAIIHTPKQIICCAFADEYEIVKRGPTRPRINVYRHYDHDMKRQNSRLVEVHLSEIHLSQIQSFAPEFICRSPPCLIQNTPV